MKQIIRSQIPAQFAEELKGKKYAKLEVTMRPVITSVEASGDDPNAVNAASESGALYRIDEGA